VTFSIKDHRILIASALLQQEAFSPQDFPIDSDPLAAIRSALALGVPSAFADCFDAEQLTIEIPTTNTVARIASQAALYLPLI
jgi:hypothetical protein